MKLFSKNVLLPALALFSYLFYLFWSAPLDLILQMYAINDLYIFNNAYVHIVTIISIVMFFYLFYYSYTTVFFLMIMECLQIIIAYPQNDLY